MDYTVSIGKGENGNEKGCLEQSQKSNGRSFGGAHAVAAENAGSEQKNVPCVEFGDDLNSHN